MGECQNRIFECVYRCLDAHRACLMAAWSLSLRYPGDPHKLDTAQLYLDCATECHRAVVALRGGEPDAIAIAFRCADFCDHMAEQATSLNLKDAEHALRGCSSSCDAVLGIPSAGDRLQTARSSLAVH